MQTGALARCGKSGGIRVGATLAVALDTEEQVLGRPQSGRRAGAPQCSRIDSSRSLLELGQTRQTHWPWVLLLLLLTPWSVLCAESPEGRNGSSASGSRAESPEGRNGSSASGSRAESPEGRNGSSASGSRAESPGVRIHSTEIEAEPCNGHAELCDRPYDEVAYATTHNAFNYAWGPEQYYFPNQEDPIPTQLQEGVRALMIDIHEYNGFDETYAGQTFVCHSYCWLGGESLVDVLASIETFLAENPREVVTLIFESYVSYEIVLEAFVDSGLLAYVHPQADADPWPTLQELIDVNERLIVLTDKDGGASDWYLDVWEFAVETHYSAESKDDLTCDPNRGELDNDLFIFNHFLTYPLARRSLAYQINFNPYLYDRAVDCWHKLNNFPNFVTVDFYRIGDLAEAVDMLNGVSQ